MGSGEKWGYGPAGNDTPLARGVRRMNIGVDGLYRTHHPAPSDPLFTKDCIDTASMHGTNCAGLFVTALLVPGGCFRHPGRLPRGAVGAHLYHRRR